MLTNADADTRRCVRKERYQNDPEQAQGLGERIEHRVEPRAAFRLCDTRPWTRTTVTVR